MVGGDLHVQPVWSFDGQTAEVFLADFSDRLAVAPVDAEVRIEQGEVIEIPPAPGRALDVRGLWPTWRKILHRF